MSYKPRTKITADNINEILNNENTPRSTFYGRKNWDHTQEYNRQYYLKNKAKLIKANAENNKIHRDRHNEYNKRYRLNLLNKLISIKNANLE